MERKASVVWTGRLRDGNGTITTESGVLSDVEYSFGTRFGGASASGGGTNPEELIAAAHAACFSMALAAELEKRGMTPDRVSTSATAKLQKDGAAWSVTLLELDTVAFVPGAEQARFEQAAESAKAGCPISRLLKAPIALHAKLEARSSEEERKKAG
ncbi:MAG: OsmC family peroxiredoxin [Deltaproteobacteria bacterium]|nr:OsmC family peroxiredoxin [Deltaproteobacteria bacterium]